jgi:hypothetical protein
MFREVYYIACSITPRIKVTGNTLEPDKIDENYLDNPYCVDYTSGCGSFENPYTYKSAAPISAYYGIVDLWFRFRPTLNHQHDIFIKVNNWMFRLTSDGAVYEGQNIRFI